MTFVLEEDQSETWMLPSQNVTIRFLASIEEAIELGLVIQVEPIVIDVDDDPEQTSG